jgi:SET domain-containing protein
MTLEVRRSGIQGRGVFADRSLREGTRIIEYTGKRISHDEADAQSRDDDPSRKHHTFLFAVDDEVCIDATSGGNEARFINHSCAPNCEVVIEGGRVFIHSLRDIARGEELVYDYWYTTDESYTMSDLRRIYPCACHAEKCRGTLARPPRRARRTSKRA